jgi:uncharacterized protein DUF4372/DDE family transposase
MMLRNASIFSQLLSVVNRNNFFRLVKQTNAEKGAKGFSCWDQFVAMMFCQLAQAKSLREIGSGLRSCEGKLKHLGLSQAPGRSTLAYANAHRPWTLFEGVFHQVLAQAQAYAPKKKLRFKHKLYSMDSTVIELCVSMFDWAKFQTTKGAVKLHLMLDHDGCLPHYALITEGKVADVSVAQPLDMPKGSIVVVDRGYIDYHMFERWIAQGVGFVTRLKQNADCFITAEHEAPAHRNIRADETIEFNVFHAGRQIKGSYRRVKVWLEDKQEELVLLTNLHDLGATTIAAIYKQRWQIELFFKAIKQNLRIKTFVGTSANAVRIQIWTALIAIVLMKLLQFRSRFKWALSNLVALLRWNLFAYRDLWNWIDDPYSHPPNREDPAQLSFFLDSTATP